MLLLYSFVNWNIYNKVNTIRQLSSQRERRVLTDISARVVQYNSLEIQNSNQCSRPVSFLKSHLFKSIAHLLVH